MASHVVGYPRMDPKRELKFALESFWDGESSAEELQKVAAESRASIWKQMADAGIKYIPSNTFSYYDQVLDTTAMLGAVQKVAAELRASIWKQMADAGIKYILSNTFSYYDQVLDTTAMLGAVPSRYSWNGREIGFDVYFSMARGNASVPAMEMTKWFDTNYHYIGAELGPEVNFSYGSHKAIEEYKEAKALGVHTVPVLVGPVSYLLLSKPAKGVEKSFSLLSLIDKIILIYKFPLDVGANAFRNRPHGGEGSQNGSLELLAVNQADPDSANPNQPASPALNNTPSASDQNAIASALPENSGDGDEQPPPDRSLSDMENGEASSPTERRNERTRLKLLEASKVCLITSVNVGLASIALQFTSTKPLSYNASILLSSAGLCSVAGFCLSSCRYTLQNINRNNHRGEAAAILLTRAGIVFTSCGFISFMGTQFPENIKLWLSGAICMIPISVVPVIF